MPPLEVVLVAPVAIALAVIVAGRRGIAVTRWLTLGSAALVAYAGASAVVAGAVERGAVVAVRPLAWLGSAGAPLPVGWAVDGAAAVMLLVVGVVASMVTLFSFGYMADDAGQARYYALLSVFISAMSALVTATTLVALFIAWELVGACSYLLIGFWYTRPKAAAAAIKAFLVTRAGDAGLLAAVLLVWREASTVAFADLGSIAEAMPPASVTAVSLLVLLGAAGKSAQFPFHVWLPDAMEGPTPVSALIHAATMVAAGVFLVVRTWPLFESSSTARAVLITVGTVTALGAALVAGTQTDVKRVLAYSTVSQLGFMFAALGAGSWVAALFHLVTHAAFKSLLFLAAGSVIHGSGTQDLYQMGGLGRAMPVTAATWLVGVGALAGLPPLAGFFSKDAVVHAVLVDAPVAGAALVVASGVTAFYCARATRLAFFGTPRSDLHAHESHAVMAVPLVFLAGVTALLGAVAGAFAEGFGGHGGVALPVALVTTAVALGGGAFGGWMFRRGPAADEVIAARLGRVWRAASAAFGFDRAVMAGARRFRVWCQALSARVDRGLIDGAVVGVARIASWAGTRANAVQTGDGSLYAAFMGVGAVVLVSLALWFAR